MPVATVLTLAFVVGIAVAIRTKSLAPMVVIVCTAFGLLMADTEPGRWATDLLNDGAEGAAPIVQSWLN